MNYRSNSADFSNTVLKTGISLSDALKCASANDCLSDDALLKMEMDNLHEDLDITLDGYTPEEKAKALQQMAMRSDLL